FIFKYSILQELRFITLPAFPAFGNQIAYFSGRSRLLISSVVRKEGLNRKKSQSKMNQLFGRNRKIVEKGVIVLFEHISSGVVDWYWTL
ncbi:hypothetical protein, partial [uncultured Parabacteroides sp.]|uniref:hypothetical protein n=1 Tax=uncultured Parabacteroides sp. TaxID=512312 RepID=UPI0025893725